MFHELLRMSDYFLPAPGSSGKEVVLWPAQKLINWMMDVVSKVYKAVQLIAKIFLGSLATAKACL